MASIVCTAILDKFGNNHDKGAKLIISTDEISSEDAKLLWECTGQYIKVFITNENVISPEIIKLVQDTEVEHWERSKSPAQRLRAVLFKCWDSDKENMPDFDTYYKSKMEQIINHYKAKL